MFLFLLTFEEIIGFFFFLDLHLEEPQALMEEEEAVGWGFQLPWPIWQARLRSY